MSVQLTTRVWEIEDEELKDARLLTLLALADYASKEAVCWPSIALLAKRTKISERQVQRVVQWLADNNYIEISKKGNGRGNVTLYKVTLKGDMVTPFDTEELTPVDSTKGDIQNIKGDIQNIKGDIGDENQSYARREPPIEPPIEPIEREPAPAPRTHRHFDPRKFIGGKIPPGTGATPAEVFYEIHTVKDERQVLSSHALTTISEQVDDLERWRTVVSTWELNSFKPTNVQGQLEWYRKGIPDRGSSTTALATNGNHRNGNLRGAEKSMAVIDEFEQLYGDMEINSLGAGAYQP